MSHSPPNTLLHQDQGVQPFPTSYLAHMVHAPLPRSRRARIAAGPIGPGLCRMLQMDFRELPF